MTRPETKAAIDETLTQLAQLHEADRARRAGAMAGLRSIVSNLDTPFDAGLDEGSEPVDPRPRSRPAEERRPEEPSNGYVPGRSPAWDWGPEVREKLYREAREAGSW